jgi:hypothetical protein
MGEVQDLRLSLFQNNLIVSDKMADQQDVLWAWGKGLEVQDDCVLLTGNGGYRCNYCQFRLSFEGFI